MHTMLKIKGYLISIFSLLLLSCIGVDKSKSYSSEFILMGSLLNKTDQASGVSQASPGAGSNGGYIGGGWNGSVPSMSSVARLKVQDAPLANSTTSGFLHVNAEFEFMESLFDGADTTPNPDSIILTVDRTEIIDSNAKLITIIPNPKEARIEIRRGGHFIPFIRNVSLTPGTYQSLKIFLKPIGTILMNDRSYVVNIDSTVVNFANSFTIALGQSTSLHFVPTVETAPEFFKDKGKYSKENYTKLFENSHDYAKAPIQFRLPLNLVSISQAIHKNPTKLQVMFGTVRISDKANSGQELNSSPTQFEILSLDNGYVGLASHNEIPSGEYASIDVSLGRNTEIELEGELTKIPFEERSQTDFKVYGNYILKPNRIFEFFLHLDPNKSLYYVPDKGYVFDPYIELESTMSFSEEQYNLLGNTLGKEQNKIARSADLVIQATVGSITPTLAPNVQGVNMIYSDIAFQVEDVLRGNVGTSSNVSSSDSRELQINETSSTSSSRLPLELTDILNLRFPGGDYNGMQLRVSSMPLFTQGEKIILYLQKNGNSYSVVRGHAGKVSYTGSTPFTHRWEGNFPIVPFKVNPNLTSQNGSVVNYQIEQTQKSGNLWSFNNTKSHISFKFEGTATGNSASSPSLICDFDNNKANLALEKKIYTGQAGNPDCTSEACSYIWICNGNAVHFDTEINSTQNSFDVISDSPATYNLQTVLNKELGRVAGLPPVANDVTNPTQLVLFRDSGSVKPILSGGDTDLIRVYYGNLTAEEDEMVNIMTSMKSIADSICNPYPCVTPQNETDSRYVIRGDEITALQRHKQQMQDGGLDSIAARLEKFKFFQKDYFTAFSFNGISAEDYMKDSIDFMDFYIQDTPTELLIPSILDLCVTIDNRNKALVEHKSELDIQYLRFLEIELKVLIQIRRSMIDELSKR